MTTVPGAGLHVTTTHVVVGPEQHGVVRHGVLVARACGDRLVRLDRPHPPAPDALRGSDVVHVSYTDRLFAARAEDSALAFRALVTPWLDAGITLSVTLHDLPAGDSPLERRRRAAYADVVSLAGGVVVNSWHELDRVATLGGAPRSLSCIPLPIEPVDTPEASEPADATRPQRSPRDRREVVVLGFVFPDRGYEHTIDELPEGVSLRALGRPAEGHDDLPEALAERARQRGHLMTTTGFVPDEALGRALGEAPVPVAPNRRVGASGSINTWIAHGRRPLVPLSPYSREIEQRRPGSLVTYDADVDGDLRATIARALADPALTRLDEGVAPGPTTDDVAASYRRHFAGCPPTAPVPLGDGRWVVAGNRWDLVAATEGAPPEVSVVVPYFEAAPQLELVLAALTLQTHPRARLQVVVADDGSQASPTVEVASARAAGLDVRLVRQERDGFRAAAARNLGARGAEGAVLAFLDGDTVPEPDYLQRISHLPALLPDATTVGRRRHADLTGWSPDRLRGWLSGVGPAPRELPEPAWLRTAYADSADLLQVDTRSHRFVISAVLALSRDLFTEIGGFDERFRGYGGEDWDLAHRAYAAGAVLAHVRDAVAWHDGPDFAGRAGAHDVAVKNDETLTLAALLPDPEARGGGQWRRPAVVVVLGFDDPVEVLATSRAAFADDADCGVWVVGAGAADCAARLDDPRIHAGPVPAEVLDRATAVVTLAAPARLCGVVELAAAADRHGVVRLPTGTVVSSRAARRADRWADLLGVTSEHLLARAFGGTERPAPSPTRPVDLAHELKRVYARSVRRS